LGPYVRTQGIWVESKLCSATDDRLPHRGLHNDFTGPLDIGSQEGKCSLKVAPLPPAPRQELYLYEMQEEAW
jgi:hypothetical protein